MRPGHPSRPAREAALTLDRHAGQASVELLGALPVLLVLGMFLFQALAVGYSAVLAGNAAEAGALSLAGGGDAETAARDALPGWSRAGMEVAVDEGRVEVSLEPPSPVSVLRDELRVTSEAAVRAPRG
ncbi:MAG: pilus assembly protein [Thermoleophilaceae bacterium]